MLGCGDDESGLDDEDARSLVEEVLARLDLPGEERVPPMDRADIPEGELEFGFHCHVQTAGFDIDDVLVAFPPAAVGHEESGGTIERVEVSMLVFDTAATASAVLDVYDDERTIDCLNRTFSEPIRVEADDPLQAGGVTAEGFKFTIGEGGIQPDGHRTFAGVVGRTLVDVTVLAPDERRGREMAEEVLSEIVAHLDAGDA
jgi:hypothetical protein